MSRAPARKKGGAPQKAPGGLDRALYVRANKELLLQLDRLAERKSKELGVTLSKADVVRSLIVEATKKAKE